MRVMIYARKKILPLPLDRFFFVNKNIYGKDSKKKKRCQKIINILNSQKGSSNRSKVGLNRMSLLIMKWAYSKSTINV